MNLKIYPNKLSGNIIAPSSKSLTHRALICAAFSQGKSIINFPLLSDDTYATIDVLTKLGAKFTIIDNKILVSPFNLNKMENGTFDCLESASTLRLLLPLLKEFVSDLSFTGSERLIERIYTNDLNSLKLEFTNNKSLINIKENLNQDCYFISGKITTQLISGMILALPFINKKLILENIDTNNPYIRMTLYMAEQFKIKYEITNNTICLKDDSKYQAQEIFIEGDFSNGANLIAISYLNPEVYVSNLKDNSIQGDKQIVNYLKQLGVEFTHLDSQYRYFSGKIGNCDINIAETPDLGPILASIASLGTDTVIISGIENLQYKESNRSLAIVDGLKKLGADINLINNKIIIRGQAFLEGNCEVDSYNDHRIIMALTAISSKVRNPYVIRNIEGISKSYPNFFKDYKIIGGIIEEVI